MVAPADEQLAQYRERIDSIDAEILALMNQRVALAAAIGKIKKPLNQPAFYRPERESQVLRRLISRNNGAMSTADIESLFREIISITRNIEAGLSVAILGPAETFSALAASQQFGSRVSKFYCATLEDVFVAVETGRANCALVPVENSAEDGVNATLERLTTSPLLVCGEVYLKIQHNLLAAAELVVCNSNAEPAAKAASDPQIAAIASVEAANTDNLNLLATNIADQSGTTTRFLVLSERETPPSGVDKTSLLLSGQGQPDAVFQMFKPLAEAGLDMTKLESTRSKFGNGGDVFFIDFTGHRQTPEIAEALARVSAKAGFLRVLGSYPAAV